MNVWRATIPDTAEMVKNLRLDRPRENSTAIIPLKEHSNKVIPNNILIYPNISASLSPFLGRCKETMFSRNNRIYEQMNSQRL